MTFLLTTLKTNVQNASAKDSEKIRKKGES
jgi:hypothetical protein